MAVINGASSVSEIKKTVKAGFFSVIRVCVPREGSFRGFVLTAVQIQWVVSPISLIIAQRYIPVEVRIWLQLAHVLLIKDASPAALGSLLQCHPIHLRDLLQLPRQVDAPGCSQEPEGEGRPRRQRSLAVNVSFVFSLICIYNPTTNIPQVQLPVNTSVVQSMYKPQHANVVV